MQVSAAELLIVRAFVLEHLGSNQEAEFWPRLKALYG